MTADDLTTILQQGDGAVELEPDVAGRIRAAMHDELEGVLDSGADVVVLRPASTRARPSNRFGWRIAAALLLVVGLGALFVAEDRDGQPVSGPPPPYLVSCLEFIRATSDADLLWPEVLAASDSEDAFPADYLTTLAEALDFLVLTSPQVEPAASELRAAAAEARRAVPDVDVVTSHLELAQEMLHEVTGLPCLTAAGGNP